MKRSIIFALLAATACTHVDTGQVDYRVADSPASITNSTMAAIQGNRCADDPAEACDPILPSRVVRRYMPDRATGWEAMTKNQVYSLSIEQGMIGSNILEGEILGRQFGKNAEIAILANVFEFAAEEGDAQKRRFIEDGVFPGKSDDPNDTKLKLVYFSNDVERHQALNFSEIPLVPRSIYGGGSIGIQLVVMEVDAQAGPVASLLTTLAKLGKEAVPVPGKAKDILFDLGESLLSGGNDDKLLEYRFVLSSGTEDSRAIQATFAPGRYVVRRMQNREVDMGWGSLRLDHNTGRLYRQSKDPAAPATFDEVRDDLYLVLNIRKYPDGTKPEFYAQRDWSTFREALQAAADTKAAPLGKVTERLIGVLADSRSADWRDGILLRWAAAVNRLDLYAARYASDFSKVDMTNCPVTAIELERRLDAAEREAQDALRAFRAEYQMAAAAQVTDQTGAVTPEFKSAGRERVITAVARYFMPWTSTGAPQADFATPDAFGAAYMDATATGDLTKTALDAARTRAADSPTCSTLIAR